MPARPTVPSPLRRVTALAALAGAAALAAAAPAAASVDDARTALAGVAEAAADGRVVPQGGPRDLGGPAERNARAVTASGAFYDAVGDGDLGLAPDLQRMIPFTSDDGRYTVGISLDTNALIEGDYVVSFVNTDGNAFTGSPTFGGADVAVTIVGHFGLDGVVTERWNGAAFQPAHFPSLISFASGSTDEVWSVSAAELGVAPGAPTSLMFGAMYAGVYDDYFDFAPEPGQAPFAFTAGALAPPPPPPAAPTAGPPPAPYPALAVRSFGLTARPGGLRLRLGWARGAGRVRWEVGLTARAGGRMASRTVRGAGTAGTRTVTRDVTLPPSWRGARVSAQLVVENGSDVSARTKSIVLPRRRG